MRILKIPGFVCTKSKKNRNQVKRKRLTKLKNLNGANYFLNVNSKTFGNFHASLMLENNRCCFFLVADCTPREQFMPQS